MLCLIKKKKGCVAIQLRNLFRSPFLQEIVFFFFFFPTQYAKNSVLYLNTVHYISTNIVVGILQGFFFFFLTGGGCGSPILPKNRPILQSDTRPFLNERCPLSTKICPLKIKNIPKQQQQSFTTNLIFRPFWFQWNSFSSTLSPHPQRGLKILGPPKSKSPMSSSCASEIP